MQYRSIVGLVFVIWSEARFTYKQLRHKTILKRQNAAVDEGSTSDRPRQSPLPTPTPSGERRRMIVGQSSKHILVVDV